MYAYPYELVNGPCSSHQMARSLRPDAPVYIRRLAAGILVELLVLELEARCDGILPPANLSQEFLGSVGRIGIRQLSSQIGITALVCEPDMRTIDRLPGMR